MDLTEAVDRLKRELTALADAWGCEPARAVLDSAIRLTLLEALSTAAVEISRELAPGSVELRLRGRDPEFVVTPPPAAGAFPPPAPEGEAEPFAVDDGAMARINVRMPEQLKAAVEAAAAREGRSVNAWLIRAASAAVQQRPAPQGPQNQKRFTGWVR